MQDKNPLTHYSGVLSEAVQESAAVTGKTVRSIAPEFNLKTSAGGRGYVSWYFSNVMQRYDFGNYITKTLAADFACALASWLRDGKPRVESHAAPAAVAVAYERDAFEDWATDQMDIMSTENCFDRCKITGLYQFAFVESKWKVWQARAALAATPANCDSLEQLNGNNDLPAAAPVELPEPDFQLKWSASAGRYSFSKPITGDVDCYTADTVRALLARAATAAAPHTMHGYKLVPVDLTPEMKREFMDLLMDGIDIYVNSRDQIEIQTDAPRRIWKAVLALSPVAPAHPAEGVQVVEQGEVLVTISGFTGSGKSAIAGEIEILCRALGLQVQWPDGDSEKNMTHADWTAALEQYKPRVRIVEQNIPFVAKKGLSK